MKIDPDSQAFPVLESPEYHPHLGLTVRQHFAAVAMQGMLANPNFNPVEIGNLQISQLALFFADGLIRQINK